MFEVPTHEDIDPLDRRGRNMSSILQVSRSYNSHREVLLSQPRGLRVEFHFLDYVLGHGLKDFPDPGRRSFELG